MIKYELDLTSTLFCDTKILTYEICLPSSVKKDGFNLMSDEYFTIPSITDTIPNSPVVHQLPTQAKRKFWIIAINGEEPIIAQGAFDELSRHQNPRGKYKVGITLYRMTSSQRKDLEEINSRFDQVRPVVSHFEVFLSKKPPTPKNIGEFLKVP